ncbi:Hsp20/alpha crystallin family protein [Pengzhenrongella sicca]|uniref:Hsp20/alpha crystallin family protein n=1 Tax=Pengzhenrongella sicca TaxID=2819238 RepID=A0A8A4ZEQ6_9MICO|nr:Hsp20/alpha crystallin family protein [Pengzhenrongella sicca]QTE28977.1 Hsp20/alpha crystallin family protein [Pengzhenrongella sicca]
MATRFDPFQEMDRLMGQVFGSAKAAVTMPMDLYRSGDHYVLQIDLPGADPGSIDVNVEDRTLTVRAQRSVVNEQDVQWLAQERPSGTYARQLTVSRGLALEKMNATYADGVLTLSIPVAEEAKPRKIEIHGAGAAPSATQIGQPQGAGAAPATDSGM